MPIVLNELKLQLKSWLSWAVVISGMIAACVFIYPQLAASGRQLNDMFVNMGAFSDAFGLQTLNFSSFDGYFAIECGNVITIGAALYAGIIGISLLARDQSSQTVEFYLAAPISRISFCLYRYLAFLILLVLLNLVLLLVCLINCRMIGECMTKDMLLLLAGNFFMQISIGTLCFGVSAVLKRPSFSAGVCLVTGFYFLQLFANIFEKAAFLKNWSFFGICDAAAIFEHSQLPVVPLGCGLLVSLAVLTISILYYTRKDL